VIPGTSSDYGQYRVAYCRFRGHHPPSHPSPKERDRRRRRLRPVIRERWLVGTRRYKLARRAAKEELDEAAAKLRLTGLGIARSAGGGLRLSLHCCSPIGAVVRREGAGKELERVGQGQGRSGGQVAAFSRTNFV
jgi:hypothetical protein